MARQKLTQLDQIFKSKAKQFEKEAAKNFNNKYNVRKSIQAKADTQWLKSQELLTYLKSAGICKTEIEGKSRKEVEEMIKNTEWYHLKSHMSLHF